MLSKSKLIGKLGMIACLVAIISCFLPWVTFPAQNETFTGFYVKKFPNGVYYGKPGIYITMLSLFILTLMLIQKLWAKRTNLFLSAFFVAFVMAVYIRFTNSLFENEITRRYGFLLLIISSLIMLISCMLPDMKLNQKKEEKIIDKAG